MAFTSVKYLNYQQLVYEYNCIPRQLNIVAQEISKTQVWGRDPRFYNQAVTYINRCNRQYKSLLRRQKALYREILRRQGYVYNI